MINFFRQYKIPLFIISLVCFGTFLRFYNLPNLYIFGFDEEYQATYAMTLVKDPHPIWIGVSASFLDYYLGPYFTYFTAFWLWLSKGDPLLTAYVAGFFGVVTSVVIFLAGWKFFNLTTGVVSSLLYAGLPLFVFYDQKYWNPMFVQLIVLTLFSSLMLVKKSSWWWLLFSAMVGAIFETDLAPLPLALIGVWFFIKGKYFLNKKLVLSCLAVFLLFYWPLLVFDYYHNWSNLTVLGRYQQQAKQAGVRFDPQSKLVSVVDTLGRFWYLNPGSPNAEELDIFCNSLRTRPSFWLSGLSIVLFLLFLSKAIRSKENAPRLLWYFLIVSIVFYLLYTGGSFEYYLHSFLTLFVLAIGVIVSQIKKLKFLLFVLIMIILAAGANTVTTSSDKFSLGSKKKLISRVMEIAGDKSFSIDQMGKCHTYEGWRYLFKTYGRTPARSFTDQNFAWLYPEEVNDDPVSYNVILSEYGAPQDKDLSGYNRIDEGGFSAYIEKVR